MKILMTGVNKSRLGGMWTVSNNYITNKEYNEKVDLTYVATSTNGSIVKRIVCMLKGFVNVKRELKSRKYDIVHIHMAEKGSVYRASRIVNMALKYNVKTVIHMHAGPFMSWYDTLSTINKVKIKKMFDKTTKVIALGEYWKKQLETLIDREKIEVLYNGVAVPKSNRYQPESRNIIFMGVLKKEKGIYDLIKAIKYIDKELDEDIIFKFCGVDLEGDTKEVISDFGLENRIKLLGWVSGEEKEKIMEDAMISILPSYFEALSMTVIEAMAYGVPVITTNVSTMNELLDSTNQLIIPGDVEQLAKKILELVISKDKRKEISENQYHRCNCFFSIEKNITNTLKIYENLMKI